MVMWYSLAGVGYLWKHDLSSDVKVQAGAAPMPRGICAEFERPWPNGQVDVKQDWGMTEYMCFPGRLFVR